MKFLCVSFPLALFFSYSRMLLYPLTPVQPCLHNRLPCKREQQCKENNQSPDKDVRVFLADLFVYHISWTMFSLGLIQNQLTRIRWRVEIALRVAAACMQSLHSESTLRKAPQTMATSATSILFNAQSQSFSFPVSQQITAFLQSRYFFCFSYTCICLGCGRYFNPRIHPWVRVRHIHCY